MTGVRAYEAILLAAGSGHRFGGGKMLAAFEGAPLIEGSLKAAFAAPVRGVTVVTGADPEAVTEIVWIIADRLGQGARLDVVHADDHLEGMGASLRRGMASLPADTQGVFVFLGDMPRIPVSVLGELVSAVEAGAPAAAPVWEGQRGHPVLFGPGLLADLGRVTGDAGAREILKGLGSALVLVPAPDAGVLFDIDQPADLTP
jgi:molybdenum cofactor cytidylyltransferase